MGRFPPQNLTDHPRLTRVRRSYGFTRTRLYGTIPSRSYPNPQTLLRRAALESLPKRTLDPSLHAHSQEVPASSARSAYRLLRGSG